MNPRRPIERPVENHVVDIVRIQRMFDQQAARAMARSCAMCDCRVTALGKTSKISAIMAAKPAGKNIWSHPSHHANAFDATGRR